MFDGVVAVSNHEVYERRRNQSFKLPFKRTSSYNHKNHRWNLYLIYFSYFFAHTQKKTTQSKLCTICFVRNHRKDFHPAETKNHTHTKAGTITCRRDGERWKGFGRSAIPRDMRAGFHSVVDIKDVLKIYFVTIFGCPNKQIFAANVCGSFRWSNGGNHCALCEKWLWWTTEANWIVRICIVHSFTGMQHNIFISNLNKPSVPLSNGQVYSQQIVWCATKLISMQRNICFFLLRLVLEMRCVHRVIPWAGWRYSRKLFMNDTLRRWVDMHVLNF